DLTDLVAWTSSDPLVATIGNAAGSLGLGTALAPGHTTLTASVGAISGNTTLAVTSATLVSISVMPTDPSIALGTTQTFTATGTFSDSTTQNLTSAVTWISSDPLVATVSNAALSLGLGTSLGTGHATITATLGGISGETALSVTPATLVW